MIATSNIYIYKANKLSPGGKQSFQKPAAKQKQYNSKSTSKKANINLFSAPWIFFIV